MLPWVIVPLSTESSFEPDMTVISFKTPRLKHGITGEYRVKHEHLPRITRGNRSRLISESKVVQLHQSNCSMVLLDTFCFLRRIARLVYVSEIYPYSITHYFS
jgi:hypothetical protein